MSSLYQKLKEYSQTDAYPCHMPGHKRRLYGEAFAGSADVDITEIEDFDNLHDAKGILAKAQEKAAAVYGAEESFFLVNGSTGGILAALSAAVPEGGSLLIARSSHRSVYHAAYLRRLQLSYLWEDTEPEFGCNRAATAEQVEEALERDPGIQAVLIVSPTYEGFVADVEKIAEVVHKKGIPLIVDEAHGAHLGFHPAWAVNSSRLGADLAVQSLHKTLPAPTQTAILHASGSRIDRERLRRFLRIYQSSSPSYVLMAAMEEAIDITRIRAEELFGAFLQNWNDMFGRLEKCEALRFLREKNTDIGKLVVADAGGSLTGQELYERLVHRYHLQPEMAAGSYVLSMFTVGDTKEGYDRMTDALLEIDAECVRLRESAAKQPRIRGAESGSGHHPRAVRTFAEAWDGEAEFVSLSQARGRVAAEFVNLYPPGVPVLVPGEEYEDELCGRLREYVECGLCVQGVTKKKDGLYVKVLKQ